MPPSMNGVVSGLVIPITLANASRPNIALSSTDHIGDTAP